MLLRSIGAVFLTLGLTDAFKNSSPFLALSTRPIGKLESAVVANADDVLAAVSGEYMHDQGWSEKNEVLAQEYYIFSQPGLTTQDLDDNRVMPKLKALAAANEYEGRVEIPGVIGGVDASVFMKELGVGSLGEALPRLPTAKEARRQALNMLDDKIAKAAAEATSAHAIILISTPASADSYENTPEHQYEMDEPYPTAMHQDLKRHVDVLLRQSGNKSTHMQDGLPLFEKYQFLTPGLFMGLTVSILMVVILWVGVSAISGLEVSYKAFSKEMGPQAQNKGKQQQ